MQQRFAPLVLLALLAGATCSRPAPITSPPPQARLAPAMVQVENAPASRPHLGLQQADVVYEYLTEGGISRFTALYWNPSGAFRVEPVRSARLVTLRLVKAYGGVLFYSGASDHVQAQISSDNVPGLSESSAGGRYFARDGERAAPHNLYTTGDRLHDGLDSLQVRVGYPKPIVGEPGAGAGSVSSLEFQQTVSHSVDYTYSPGTRTYAYADENGPMVDAASAGRQIAVTNVVLVRVAHHDAGYVEDVLGAEGIDFDLQGSGSADIYSRGTHLAATWDLSQGPMRFLGAGGRPLPLPAGLTWIHLVDPDTPVRTN